METAKADLHYSACNYLENTNISEKVQYMTHPSYKNPPLKRRSGVYLVIMKRSLWNSSKVPKTKPMVNNDKAL